MSEKEVHAETDVLELGGNITPPRKRTAIAASTCLNSFSAVPEGMGTTCISAIRAGAVAMTGSEVEDAPLSPDRKSVAFENENRGNHFESTSNRIVPIYTYKFRF